MPRAGPVRPQRAERGGDDGAGLVASTAGEQVALALSYAGSDWRRWRIRQRRDRRGVARPRRVEQVLVGRLDEGRAGFFYGRYPEPPADAAYDAPNLDMELRYHRLGTDSADDPLMFSVPTEPEWGFEPEVSDDGRLLVVTIWRGTDPESRIYVADLADGVEAARGPPVLDGADARYEHVATVDGTLYLLTDREAPLGRVIAVDIDDPSQLREVIAGDRTRRSSTSSSSAIGSRWRTSTTPTAGSRCSSSTGVTSSTSRCPGSAPIVDDGRPPTGRGAVPDIRDVRLAVDGPGRADGRRSVREIGRPALAWDPDDYVSEQVFVTSEDGTPRPVVPDSPPRRRPERRRPTSCSTATAGSTSRSAPGSSRSGWPGWSAADCSRSRRSVGEGSTARHGTTPAAASEAERVRRFRRVPPVAGGIGLDPERSGSRSAADRTAGCSSARRSPSIRSCSAPRSPRSG